MAKHGRIRQEKHKNSLLILPPSTPFSAGLSDDEDYPRGFTSTKIFPNGLDDNAIPTFGSKALGAVLKSINYACPVPLASLCEFRQTA